MLPTDIWKLTGEKLREEDLASLSRTNKHLHGVYNSKPWIEKLAISRYGSPIQLREGEPYLKQLREHKIKPFISYLDEVAEDDNKSENIGVSFDRKEIRDFIRIADISDIKMVINKIYSTFSEESIENFMYRFDYDLGKYGKEDIIKNYAFYMLDIDPDPSSLGLLIRAVLDSQREELYDFFKTGPFREVFKSTLNEILDSSHIDERSEAYYHSLGHSDETHRTDE